MNMEQFWADALGVSSDQIENWKSEAPDHIPLASWCLSKNYIDQTKYFDWAKEYFQLAAIQPEFFSNAQQSELFEKFKFEGWSQNLVPIAEWDGVVFVACTEPTAYKEWPFPVQFLLAPQKNISEVWTLHSGEAQSADNDDAGLDLGSLSSETEEKPLEVEAAAEPEKKEEKEELDLDMDLGTDLSAFADSFESKEETPDEGEAEAEQEEPAEDEDPMVPEGLDFNLSDDKGSDSGDSSESVLDFSSLQVGGEEKEEEPAPEGLEEEIKSEDKKDDIVAETNNEDENETFLNAPPPPAEAIKFAEASEDSPAEELGAPVAEEESAQEAQPAAEAEDVKEPVAEEAGDADDSAFHDSILEEITQMKQQTGPEGQINIPSPDTFEQAETEEQSLAWFFTQALESYWCSMMINVDGNTANVWRWDHTWKAESPKLDVDGTVPSLFRIVLRTKKSYHGPVNDIPLHKEFFESWGYSSLPEVVTAVPIVEDDVVKMIWLLVGTKNENEAVKSLSDMETIAMMLGDYVKTLKKAA